MQIWSLKICNHDISKTITARSFKLSQLIEDDEKSYFIFIELSPFADLDFIICYHDILKTTRARSFKLGQLIEDDE